ncbi:YfiR/HmsC family protein [Thalassotalea profundi]|uniref:histidine kinase n=1 Tax=Thalassotalea profundi TaxID=2036687 RepID=A0ABQ3IBE1_9GAMM|nr:YfiR/HmsC family protein [Thalassotalea profundi]GHE77177.1 hypothetical protein GCM10011501_00770 [Thalassotalea profundi]
MEATFSQLRSKLLLILMSIGLFIGGQAWAQTSTLEYEKARLVSKFAKFVTWPDDAIKSEFIIGIYENTEKYEYFNEFFKNKGVKGKDITVRLITSFQEIKDVNILYITSSRRNLLKLSERSIRGSNALIITENSFELDKTMIDITYDKDQSALTFSVNDVNLLSEKLELPELSLFLDTNNNEEILSDSPSYILQKQKEEHLLVVEDLLKLQKQFAQQKTTLNTLTKKLQVSEESSKKYNLALQEASNKLMTLQEESKIKSEDLDAKNAELKTLAAQINTLKTQLENNENVSQNVDVNEPSSSAEDEQSLTDLTAKLAEQKEVNDKNILVLANVKQKLASVNKENKLLTSFQLLFYVFVVITLIALIIAFLMWRKAKYSSPTSLPLDGNESNKLLPVREEQLIKSENVAALGYVATDVTYAVGLSLVDLNDEFVTNGDKDNVAKLKPIVTLLENFNLIAADQDDTDIQHFDLVSYMQKMMMLYEFEFSQSDIDYRYLGEKSLMINSVPSYIALVLLNLINNSLKHGFDNKGNGSILLKAEKGAKNGITITYADDGKGMSQSTLAQVFTPFFTTRSDRGYVGVGMSTTYDIIKNKLSGDIKIESKEGKGTTVIINLT